jgi:hypothetical protein
MIFVMAFWVQFAPGNPAEVLVTSADSQIRVFDNVTMVQKFRGTEIRSQNFLKRKKGTMHAQTKNAESCS